MTAKLITHEKDNEKTFVVTEAGLTIGRHADNQASLDDSRLSRFHARIKFKDGAWYAEDLGSTNGSFINDKIMYNAGSGKVTALVDEEITKEYVKECSEYVSELFYCSTHIIDMDYYGYLFPEGVPWMPRKKDE